MKARKPILPYKVGTCLDCKEKDKKLISKRCFEQPNFCYQNYQKANYLEKQKAKVKTPPKPLKKISDKRKKENVKYEKAKTEYFLDHPTCEYPGCNSENRTLHHGAGRCGSLFWDKKYFKTLCPEHHSWVELNAYKAKELGLSFNRLDK